jgi:RNA 2',3'-cyclic 3'-phosphodiesterase
MTAAAPEHVRAFIAITLDPGQIVELKQIQRQLQAQVPGEAVRWVRPDQLHLTLRFLGNVPRAKLAELSAALNRATEAMASFRLALAGVGCFPDTKRPRVVWIGMNGDLDSLRRLQSQIEHETQYLGDHRESRDFQPHLTIGRVKAAGIAARKVGECIERAVAPPAAELAVRQIHLIQSELSPAGARYTTLATAALYHGRPE